MSTAIARTKKAKAPRKLSHAAVLARIGELLKDEEAILLSQGLAIMILQGQAPECGTPKQAMKWLFKGWEQLGVRHRRVLHLLRSHEGVAA